MTPTPGFVTHETLRLLIAYPDHSPRASDPHYHLFNQTRARLARLGKLVCWIGNADCSAGAVELHHDKVEFSLANDVDVAKFADAYGLHLDSDEEFLAFIEGEGNLTPLCVYHHRAHGGIHSLPYPLWVVQKYLKDGVTAPAKVVAP